VKQFLSDLDLKLPYYKDTAKAWICALIDSVSYEELVGVFKMGRKEYGGTFDVESIPGRDGDCQGSR